MGEMTDSRTGVKKAQNLDHFGYKIKVSRN